MIENLTTTVGGSLMTVHLARPEAAGPRPVVLVFHHKSGVDAFTRDRLERLAAAGHLAAAPDFYHRTPEADADGKMAALQDAQIVADAAAALSAVKQAAPARDGAVATLGHCMGGRMSFLVASSLPTVRAAVVYYSGNMFKSWGDGPTPFERLGGLRASVAGFFGKDDKNPSPADVEKIDAELTRLGVKHDFHSYDGAAHAFQNFANPASYREAAEKDSWSKTLTYLASELQP